METTVVVDCAGVLPVASVLDAELVSPDEGKMKIICGRELVVVGSVETRPDLVLFAASGIDTTSPKRASAVRRTVAVKAIAKARV